METSADRCRGIWARGGNCWRGGSFRCKAVIWTGCFWNCVCMWLAANWTKSVLFTLCNAPRVWIDPSEWLLHSVRIIYFPANWIYNEQTYRTPMCWFGWDSIVFESKEMLVKLFVYNPSIILRISNDFLEIVFQFKFKQIISSSEIQKLLKNSFM